MQKSVSRRGALPRAAAVGGALLLTVGTAAAGALALAGPATADPLGDCTPTTGAVVAVDFAHWGGGVARGCDAHPTTGMNLLHNAGFTTTGTVHDGPGFICRIGSPDNDNGTEYPTAADEPCTSTPLPDAYWSYWIAPAGQDTWTYSPKGALSDVPEDGEVEAWVFGPTDIGGTDGGPSFTPASVRAQDAPTTPPPTTPPPTTPVTTPPTTTPVTTPPTTAPAEPSATPDLGKAARYLTDPANLIDGHYYEAFPDSGFADFGLTIDAALALAATGGSDDALAKITDFVQSGKDGSDRTIADWTGVGTAYASGGSIAKEALLAEVTGADPRAFGGHDLIAELDATLCAKASKAPDTSCAAPGNYSYATSVFSQSLGVIAQLRAGDTGKAAGPIAYLESLQQPTGAFPSLLPPTGDSEVDSTAMALMALDLVPGDTAQQAVAKGVAWIAKQQETDGGFPGASGDSVNSAALAVQGLSLDAGTYAEQIAKARAFLAHEQNSDGGFNVSSDGDPSGSDVRASAQATGGAVGTSFGTLVRDLGAHKSAASGAGYLVKQLTDGNHLASSFGPDYGLTADLALALAASGGQDETLAKVDGYLFAHVADYADPAGTSAYPGPYTGSAAKLTVLAEVTGQDPTAVGGFDLLKTLTDNVCTAATTDGFCTAPGDFSQAYSTVSQALGVLALARAGVAPPAAALDRLDQLQCADGGFSSTLIAPGADCVSDVDTTGYAVQALSLLPAQADRTAAGRAFLVKSQVKGGGFPGAAGVNANSTALALQALTATSKGRPQEVADGQKFLAGLQNTDGGFRITADADQTDSDTRSTTQAVPALAGTALTDLTHVVAPAGDGTGDGGTGTGTTTPAPPTSTGSGTGTATATSSAPAAGSGANGGDGDGTVPDGNSGGSLAATGTDVLALAALAGALVAVGGVFTAARRRARPNGRHQ
ncbi:prenyltransferase/squalene oxidase repeat-containing protein [Streptomyces sp. CA-111067]|uniref:prenyltransferase/squalene oxidase repeat-containing protein n=1 Tax=Streptomyces sp. CA-111067 TaxID=3240046 RepID=UPI003D95F1AF